MAVKARFCRDSGGITVLESSCIYTYTAVLRAVISCPHNKITLLQPFIGLICGEKRT